MRTCWSPTRAAYDSFNAYVSGFGATRRIVVYDTLVETAPEEVRLIVAHELGHAKARDVVWGTLMGAVGVALLVCVLALLGEWQWLLGRAGITTWGFSGGPPGMLQRRGITKDVLKVGDTIKVDGFRAKDGSTNGSGGNVTFSDGRKVFAGSAETSYLGQ